MPATEYIVGAALMLVTVGAAGLAGAVVVVRRGGALPALERAIAWFVLTAGFVFAAHLVPGLLGLLDRGTVPLVSVAIAALASRVRGRPAEAGSPITPSDRREDRLSWAIALATAGAAGVYLLALCFQNAAAAVVTPDAITFHLPNVARWIESGSFWSVDDFVPDRAAGNYPQTGDVFVLAAILPWHADFLARFVGFPFVALAALSAFAASRELRASQPAALSLAAAFCAMPVVAFIAAAGGITDPEMLGLFGAGGFFLLRHWRTDDPFDLVLAGVGLGLAFGTRWYAVYAVGAVILVWLAAGAVSGRIDLLRQGGLMFALVAICGGFWLLRNLVESGNPVFPVRVAPLDLTIFDAPRDLVRETYGDSLADYADDPTALREVIWPSFLRLLSFVSILLWAALAVGAVAAFRERDRARSARLVLAGVAIAAIIGVAYTVTPYTASGFADRPTDGWVNTRYVAPALLVGVPVSAWVVTRLGRLSVIPLALVFIATLDALRRVSELDEGDVGAPALLAAAVALGAIGACAIYSDRVLGRIRGSPIAIPAGVVAILAAAIGAGAVLEERHSERRYAGNPVVEFIDEQAPEGHRVGLVGEGFGAYPAAGPELGNHVEYIGFREDEMLRAYRDRASFSRAVRQARYDLIWAQPLSTLHPGLPRRQLRWLRPLGYERIAEGTSLLGQGWLRLYARAGPAPAEEAGSL